MLVLGFRFSEFSNFWIFGFFGFVYAGLVFLIVFVLYELIFGCGLDFVCLLRGWCNTVFCGFGL